MFIVRFCNLRAFLQFGACKHSPFVLQSKRNGDVAQLVSALRSHRRGRGFESLHPHQIAKKSCKCRIFVFTIQEKFHRELQNGRIKCRYVIISFSAFRVLYTLIRSLWVLPYSNIFFGSAFSMSIHYFPLKHYLTPLFMLSHN